MLKQLSLFQSSPVVPAEHGPGAATDELQIRVSPKAKRLTLQAQPPFGVELVVPKRARPEEVESFIRKHRSWIASTQAEIHRAYPSHLRQLPESIELPAAQRNVRVDIVTVARGKRAYLRDRGVVLEVGVYEEHRSQVATLLRRWLLNEARKTICRRAAALSEQLGLRYSRLQVRTQRTRWGSCSNSGTLSINACSLFLEPELVDYLLIHEICHLKYLNHSSHYWRLVAQHEPNYRALDRDLGKAWVKVPAWAYKDRVQS